jgi:Family of unknown function (DUF5906)
MSDKFEDEIEEMQTDATSPSSPLPACTLDDLCSYAPSRACIYLPCKTLWPNASVDDRLPPMPLRKPDGTPVTNAKGKVVMIPASEWLAKHRSIEAMTWDPSKPEFIRDRVVVDGGYIDKPGATTLNYYRPPPEIKLGDAAQATRWVEHWKAIYPDDATHIIAWLACRVQRPGDKINHALVLGGAPKIGKDTLLEAVVRTVGEWNFQNIKLNHLISRNNAYFKALFVRLSEARDVGEQGHINRYRLYDHMKDALVIPPDTLRVNEKYINEYYILNRFGMVVTTNYRDAFFLRPDDRRHYVAFSERRSEEFPAAFWKEFWGWYESGGFQHVATLLYQYDLSDFDPKAEPPKTDAFWDMVQADRDTAFGELMDAIDTLGNPPALTFDELMVAAPSLEWLHDPNKRKAALHRLAECQYTPVRNPAAKDGLWRINKRRQVIYVRLDLPSKQRLDIAMVHQDELNSREKNH